MNHLQTMELQLTSVLLEATLKMAAMIDANVFVVVESSGRRYFSGRKYLVDSYLTNCLGPSPGDVELEIHADVCALREKESNGGNGDFGISALPSKFGQRLMEEKQQQERQQQ